MALKVNRPKCKPLIVGSFNRAPDDNIDQFLEGLNQSLGSLDSVEIVILGDFNVDFSSSVRRSPMKQKFNSCLMSHIFIKWSSFLQELLNIPEQSLT